MGNDARKNVSDLSQRFPAPGKQLDPIGSWSTAIVEDVLDGSDIGLFVLDADFRIVWITRSIERFFGLSRAEVIGQDKRKLIQERIQSIFEDARGFSERVLATYDDNTYVESFECHVLPDGERHR